MSIQEKLVSYLKEKQYKGSTIAEICEIHPQRVYRILNGKVKMTADEFFKICEFYNIDMEVFKWPGKKFYTQLFTLVSFYS